MRWPVCGFLLSCVLWAPSPATAGMIFNILFDDSGYRPDALFVEPPVVGSGQLSFSNDLVDGSYPLLSLTDLAFSITLGGETWTETDTVSFDPDTEIVIENFGRQFYFNGSGNTTPTGGAVEVYKSNGEFLSFEPTWFSAVPWNLYGTSTGYFGVYGVTPEPTSWCLALTGALCGLLAAKRGRRTQKAE